MQGTPLTPLEEAVIQKAFEQNPQWQAEYMKMRLNEAKQAKEVADQAGADQQPSGPPKDSTRREENSTRREENPKRKKRNFFDILQRKIQKIKEGKLDSSEIETRNPAKPELDENPEKDKGCSAAPSEDSDEGSLSES